MGREVMQPVELPDEPGDGAGPDAVAAPTDRPATGGRRRRRRLWALALATTLVVGLLGAQAALDARERDTLARLQTLPGVLAPVDASIGVRWATTDWSTVYSLAGGTFGDLSIGSFIDDEGVRGVRAVRTRTGAVAWSTVLSVAIPPARPRGVRSTPACSVDGEAKPPRVVCLVSDAARLDSSDGTSTAVPATFATLVVLDPATGEKVAQQSEPISTALSLSLVDGLAVLASRSDTGHFVVVGQDVLTGSDGWRFESGDPLSPALTDAWSPDPSGLDVAVVSDHVAVTASGGEVWVLSPTGDLVDHVGPGHRTAVEVLRRDRIAVVDYGPSTSTSRTMRIVLGDGSLGAAFDQLPVPLQVDDGSVPDLLFTMSDKLVAWDMRSGKVAWSTGVSVSASSLLLDSRLYTRTTDGHLYAIDARSGTALWDVPLASGIDSSLATDGRAILASETSTTGPLSLVAFAPDDGRRLWAAPLPPSVTFVLPFGRQLIGATEDGRETFVLG